MKFRLFGLVFFLFIYIWLKFESTHEKIQRTNVFFQFPTLNKYFVPVLNQMQMPNGYLLIQSNNESTRTLCEIYSKLTMRRSGAYY